MTSDNGLETGQPFRRERSSYRMLALRIAILAALLGILAFTLDLSRLPEFLTLSLLLAVIAAQPILVFGCAIFAIRLRYLVPQKLRFSEAFSAFVLPIGLNVALPARLSELFKPAFLNRSVGVPLPEAMAALVLERALDLAALGLLALVILPGAYLTKGNVAWLSLAVMLAVALPFLSRWSVLHVFPLLPERIKPLRTFAEALGTLGGFRRYGHLLALTAVGWASSLLSVHVVLVLAGRSNVDIWQSSTVFLLTILGGLVAVLPAGVGTFQAAAMVGLVSFGFSAEESLVLAIALQVAALAFPFGYLVTLLLVGSNDIDIVHQFTRRKNS